MRHQEGTKACRAPACSMPAKLALQPNILCTAVRLCICFYRSSETSQNSHRTPKCQGQCCKTEGCSRYMSKTCLWSAVNHLSAYLPLTFREKTSRRAWRSWQSSSRCWRRILGPATTTPLHNLTPPLTVQRLLSGLQLVIHGKQIHIHIVICLKVDKLNSHYHTSHAISSH